MSFSSAWTLLATKPTNRIGMIRFIMVGFLLGRRLETDVVQSILARAGDVQGAFVARQCQACNIARHAENHGTDFFAVRPNHRDGGSRGMRFCSTDVEVSGAINRQSLHPADPAQ